MQSTNRTIRGFQLTLQCNKLIDAVLAGENLIGEAFAGTGKSTSLLAVEKYHSGRGLYVCYGKTLEEEARELFNGNNVDIATSHSLALSFLPYDLKQKVLARTNIPLNELAIINFSNFNHHKDAQQFANIPTKTIAQCINITTKQFIETASKNITKIHLNQRFFSVLDNLVKTKKLTSENKDLFVQLILDCSNDLAGQMLDLNSECPTTHDGYLKSWQLSNPVLNYDYILFDEAQDSNPVLLHIVLSQQCQKILVADSYQNIFQFRGSLNVINLIKYKKYPLTFSFRYGQQLADLASKVLGHIDSKVSILGRGWDTQIFKGSECEHSEPFLFIANSNYSTYEILIDCYKCKLPAKLLGGNKAPNTQEILKSLISFKRNNTALHRDHKKYDSFSDLLKRNKSGETIKLANLVEDNIEHAEELINALEWSRQTLASEAIVSLTTAHLSKGLEADNVFISDDFHSIIEAFTNGKAINESDLYLFYVAITRAKKSLMLPDALYMALEENKQFKVTKNKLLPCQTDNLQHLLNDPGINKQEVKKKQVEPEQSEKPSKVKTKPQQKKQASKNAPVPLESLDKNKPKNKSKARNAKKDPTAAKSGKSPSGVDFDGIAIEIGQCKASGESQYWTPTDTNRYLNPNLAILGTMGTGKTQAVKSLLLQIVRQKHKNTGGLPFGFLVFDFKNDYADSEFVEAIGATVFESHLLPINPLALYSTDKLAPIKTGKGVVSTIAKAFNLGRNQQSALKKCIMTAYERNGIDNGEPSTFHNPAPTLNDVYNIYNNRDKVPQDSLTAALDDIVDFELFEKNRRKCKNLFDTLKDNVIVINLSGVDSNLQNLIVATLLDSFFIQMHCCDKPVPTSNGHRAITNFVLVDEADSLMSQNFDALGKLLKQGREFGVGAILSTQGLDHFKTDEHSYGDSMCGWVVHRLESPKPAAIASLFNQNDKAEQNKTLVKVRELEKHHSFLIDGKKQLIFQESTAFWKII